MISYGALHLKVGFRSKFWTWVFMMLSKLDLIMSVFKLARVLWEDLSLGEGFPSAYRQIYCRVIGSRDPPVCVVVFVELNSTEDRAALAWGWKASIWKPCSSSGSCCQLEGLCLVHLPPFWFVLGFFKSCCVSIPKMPKWAQNLLYGSPGPSWHLWWILAETTFLEDFH